MTINSRDKGARGERDWAAFLRDELGFTGARRGQQFAGSPDSPDVVGGIPGTHPEVKFTERLLLDPSMKQSERDAGKDEIPYVVWRKARGEWHVIVKAKHLRAFAKAILAGADILD